MISPRRGDLNPNEAGGVCARPKSVRGPLHTPAPFTCHAFFYELGDLPRCAGATASTGAEAKLRRRLFPEVPASAGLTSQSPLRCGTFQPSANTTGMHSPEQFAPDTACSSKEHPNELDGCQSTSQSQAASGFRCSEPRARQGRPSSSASKSFVFEGGLVSPDRLASPRQRPDSASQSSELNRKSALSDEAAASTSADYTDASPNPRCGRNRVK